MSTEERKRLQSELGVAADGIWGPNTSAAYNAAYARPDSGDFSGYQAEWFQPVTSSASVYSMAPTFDSSGKQTGTEKVYTTTYEQDRQNELEDSLALYVKPASTGTTYKTQEGVKYVLDPVTGKLKQM